MGAPAHDGLPSLDGIASLSGNSFLAFADLTSSFIRVCRRLRHRHPFSKACLQYSQAVIQVQPCKYVVSIEQFRFFCRLVHGELAWLFLEPHTSLSENAAGMQACFRKRMSDAAASTTDGRAESIPSIPDPHPPHSRPSPYCE